VSEWGQLTPMDFAQTLVGIAQYKRVTADPVEQPPFLSVDAVETGEGQFQFPHGQRRWLRRATSPFDELQRFKPKRPSLV
jgi:hypothetical protein